MVLLDFSLGLFPEASIYFAPFVFVLSIIAIIYTSLVALVQNDMKKLIAYSSVAHMGFVTIGIFVFNKQGIEGSIFQMISHGIISSALFLCVGVIYDRMHTRQISQYGGIVNVMPKYATMFMIFTLGSLGLPGTSGFIGEILVLIGAFKFNYWIAFLAAIGVILSACYSLWLYGELFLVKLKMKNQKFERLKQNGVSYPNAFTCNDISSGFLSSNTSRFNFIKCRKDFRQYVKLYTAGIKCEII